VTDSQRERAVDRIRTSFPSAQAIYVFGSVAMHQDTESSDIDIGLLLPHAHAARTGSLRYSDLRFSLEEIVGRAVDLVNLRQVSIVLQKEVLATGDRIYTRDRRATEEYEMLVISLYGKLNEERREILEEFERTGRAYAV
jgi:predicted nucleotidyltransferase